MKYIPSPRSPWFSEETYYDVWQIRVGDRVARSFEESQEGWESDEALRPWLAGVFGLCTVYLAFLGYRVRATQTEAR